MDEKREVHEKPFLGGNTAAPEISSRTVPIEIGGKFFDIECSGAGDVSLRSVLDAVRNQFSLGALTVLKVRVSESSEYLDLDRTVTAVLTELRSGAHLIIELDELRILGTKDKKIAQVEGFRLKEIGVAITDFQVSSKDTVHVIEGDYVLIKRETLSLLREHIERPLMLEGVCLFLGVTLGAIASILIALGDNTMTDLTRGRLWGSLIACLIFSLFLLVLGYLVRGERKKILRPVISKLSAKDGQDE
jgi:hypothetical protein